MPACFDLRHGSYSCDNHCRFFCMWEDYPVQSTAWYARPSAEKCGSDLSSFCRRVPYCMVTFRICFADQLLIIYIVDHLWGLIVWHCSLSLRFPWEVFAISRYACQPLVLHESHCGLLEEVYDYGSGCLCCTPGGELNQRLNNMMMWGRFAGKKAAYPDPSGDS